MGNIPSYPVEYYIKELKEKASNINYAEIKNLLTWSAKYLEHQNKQIQQYEDAMKISIMLNEKISNEIDQMKQSLLKK